MALTPHTLVGGERRGRPDVPRELREDRQARAQPRRLLDGVGRHADGVEPVAEATQGTGSDVRPRTRVEGPVAFHVAAVGGVEDQPGGLVEAVARLRHVDAEARVLAPRQAATQAEHGPAIREVVEQHDLLRHAQRIVPRQDEGAGAEPDALGLSGQPGEELRVVRTGRVVEEVVLDHEHLVEAERLRQLRDAALVRHVLGVRERTSVVLEDELECDVHAPGVPQETPAAQARIGPPVLSTISGRA